MTGEHRAQPVRELGVARHAVRDLALADLLLGATRRFAIVASGTRNARAMYDVSSPPSRRSVSATCALAPVPGDST